MTAEREAAKVLVHNAIVHALVFHGFDRACEMDASDMAYAIADRCPEPDGPGLLAALAAAAGTTREAEAAALDIEAAALHVMANADSDEGAQLTAAILQRAADIARHGLGDDR